MLTFSGTQKKLLIALAHERTREFDDDYRSRYLLGAASTVNSAKKVLIEYGHIECTEGNIVLQIFIFPVILEVIEFENRYL